MAGRTLKRAPASPEGLVSHLLSHLRKHALWDILLIFLPPLLVGSYLLGFFNPSRTTYQAAAVMGAVALGAALILGIRHRRRKVPTALLAARWIDEKVDGRERFLTLTTIDPSICPASMLSRLRGEAAALLHRVDPKRDFPYRVKRSFFISLATSLAFLLLSQLAFRLAPLSGTQVSTADDLASLAHRLSQAPGSSEMARSLETLAEQLKKRDLSSEERRALVRELLQRVEERISDEPEKGGTERELLGQAADALRGLEQSSVGGGPGTEPSEKGEGEGKELAQRIGEKRKGGPGRLGMEEKDEGAARKQKTEREDSRAGTDRSRDEEEKGKESGAPGEGGLEEKGGKGRLEEQPIGPPPERFLKPGEQGEAGLKDARFVTVQLPEEANEDSSAEGGSAKRRIVRPKVPVSNVPLSRQIPPDAAPENQHLPLEYRALIR